MLDVLKKNSGYSLIEVIVAMVGLSLTVLLLGTILTMSVRTNTSTRDSDMTLAAARAKMNELVASTVLINPNGNTTGNDQYTAPNGNIFNRNWTITPVRVGEGATATINGASVEVTARAVPEGAEPVTISGFIDRDNVCNPAADVADRRPLIILANNTDIQTGTGTSGDPIIITRLLNFTTAGENVAGISNVLFTASPNADPLARELRVAGTNSSTVSANRNGNISITQADLGAIVGATIQPNAPTVVQRQFNIRYANCAGNNGSDNSVAYITFRFQHSTDGTPGGGDQPTNCLTGNISNQSFSGDNTQVRNHNITHTLQVTTPGITWTIAGAPAGITIPADNTAQIRVATTTAVGPHSFSVTATPACNAALARTITVTVEVTAPQAQCAIGTLSTTLWDVTQGSIPATIVTLPNIGTNGTVTWAHQSGSNEITVASGGAISIPQNSGAINRTATVRASCGSATPRDFNITVRVQATTTGCSDGSYITPLSGNAIRHNTGVTFDACSYVCLSQRTPISWGSRENCTSTPGQLGYLSDGSWITYNIRVGATGAHRIIMETARQDAGDATITVSTGSAATTITAPSTGNWGTFGQRSGNIDLNSGDVTIRLTVNSSTIIRNIRIEQISTPTHTIIFDRGNNPIGGTVTCTQQTVTEGSTIQLPGPSCVNTNTGFSFLGWNTQQNATTASLQAGANFTVNATATLFAIWQATGSTGCGITASVDGNINGQISPSSASTCGNHIFTFTPNAGFEIEWVRVDGNNVTPTPTGSHTVNVNAANMTIRVRYRAANNPCAGIPAWTQKAYATGDKVLHGGNLYRALRAVGQWENPPSGTGDSWFWTRETVCP